MEKKEILSMEDAQELLQRLERFYGQPVLPLENFCQAIELWMDCIQKNNTDPTLLQGGTEHGRDYFKSLYNIRMDIRKSNLLGRLLYAKESLRTRRCPLRRGHFSGRRCLSKNAPTLVTEQAG